ncbi:MAG: 3-keto-5-aminohexanoate cleavage protein [Rhodospirillales bacterium]|nr:3-keto-5-aminohexanoate cleavage protein [Rhodospirillales bacterium]
MADIKGIYAEIETGLHAEARLATMDKKLIINVAPTGSFTSRQQNPLQPYTMEENVKSAIEAYKAGAAVWHVHARDNDGLPSKDPHVVKQTIDRVFDACPDIVTSVLPYADYDKQGMEQIKPTVDILKAAGAQYMETAVLLIMSMTLNDKFTYVVSETHLKETVKYMEDHGVRPEYQGHAYSGMKDVMDWLIDTGIAKDPPIMNVMCGFHGFNHASPLTPDPWSYVNVMSLAQVIPAGAVKGFCAGGRNWLPFSTLGIMLGMDMVRVGMEDSVFVHPHKDEKLTSSAQAVELVRNIAESLGREIATPDEARQILGIAPRDSAGLVAAK